MNLRRSSFFAALLAASLLPAQALAKDPTAEDRATARELAAQAHQAFDAKDFKTAAEKFARADALVHAPTLMLWLARSQVQLGQIVAANESLNRILREEVPPNAPKVWTDALEEARREVAAVTARLSWITINVKGATGHEEDLHVFVDGKEMPVAGVGLPRAVDVGAHKISAFLERSPNKPEGSVTVTEGQRAVVNLEVGPWVPPPPGTPPKVKGTVLPNGMVVVQGLEEPYNPTRKYIGFGFLGVGGVGIVVGAATGGAVIAKHKSLVAACPGGRCPPSEVSAMNTYNLLGTVSTAGFIAGGVLAAGGLILVLTAPKPPKTEPTPAPASPSAPPPKVGLEVMPTLGGVSFGAVGSF